MGGSAPVARSSSPGSIGLPKTTHILSYFWHRKNSNRQDLSSCAAQHRGRQRESATSWKPPAIRAPVLILAIAICWSLIAVLQFLLNRSQRDSGIIFAPSINDLPLSRTFLYSYFPTIVAVVFSMYWAWIDLETKRMEPYYQLSKENGALGKDTLLLHYPFDFMPFVPLKAFRDRHWSVFWASFVIVLVTWGLVPVQAGIFSTRTISRTVTLPFDRSTAFVPASKQASNLTFLYAQSAYNIATLNETLAHYMARNYTLAPFRPSFKVLNDTPAYGNWSASTTMYSLDLHCEPAILVSNPPSPGTVANSTSGCSFHLGLDGNLTIGMTEAQNSSVLANKDFTAMYVGYWNPLGFAEYSLDEACPTTSNSTFYAAIQRNKAKDTDPIQNVTAIFCTPVYYQQRVTATVNVMGLEAIRADPLGEKEPISTGLFNTTLFEELMNTGSLGQEVRGDLIPSESTPDYYDYIAGTNLSLSSGPNGGGQVQDMVGLALAVSNRPLEDYLDWNVLSKSYTDAYRLMFACAMRAVLDEDFQTADGITGQTQVTTEAVVLEPVFVYTVEGLLGVVSLATTALLYLSLTRPRAFCTNPSTIAAVMAMVADNQPLLTDFEGLDCCTMEQIENQLGRKRYKLVDDGSTISIVQLGPDPGTIDAGQSPTLVSQRRNSPSNIAKPVRPVEFSLWMALPFVGVFITLAISLNVVFDKSRMQGLPLPSSNTIVQNILENYIPTAIATFIEPAWVLIDRLLCMLQPIEELQSCKGQAKKSIDLDYSSLPPQLVIFKALRSRHFVLAAVCAMALLANLLAVAFAGLFFQATIDIRHPTLLHLPFDFKFVPIDGNVGPIAGEAFGSLNSSGAYQGGNGEGIFFVADSYMNQGTRLPAWTDETMFYLPFSSEGENATLSNPLEARTRAFGAKLDCTSLEFDDNFQAGILDGVDPTVNITVTGTAGTAAECTKRGASMRLGPISTVENSCVTGPVAAELVFVLGPTANTTQADADTCMGSVVLGWLRAADGSCGKAETATLNKQNATFVHCRPRLMTGFATVQVDATGRLQQEVKDLVLDETVEKNSDDVFSNNPLNLIGQSNRYIFKTDSAEWHNDSFTNDFINYFITHSANNSRLVDPTQGLPSFDDIERPLNEAYSLLFAIWMGTNKDKLLVPHATENLSTLEGWRIQPESRLFLSTPMFAISEGILCIYAIVAIMVYMRRPGQYLARMPTSIASLIALFAASAAVLDMRGTSTLDSKGRAQHLEKLDARYGYGSFIGGGDGRVHIGIEKVPFVSARPKAAWLERYFASFRKGSTRS